MRRSVTGNSTKGFLFNMAKDTFYFSHDYNARHDEKITSLMMEYGMEGYGIFWAIVEDLYNNANVLRTNYKRIAYELRVDEAKVKFIIENFGLFIIDGENFGSLSIQKRLEERAEKSKKAKESVKARWAKSTKVEVKDTNVEDTPTIVEVKDTTEQENDTIKERKGKERNYINEAQLLTIEECRILYDSNYQNQKVGICTNPRWTFEQLKFFQDEFDLHVSKKETHKTMSDYKSHFANWTAKLSKEQKQSILQKSIQPKKEQSILEKYGTPTYKRQIS